MNTFKPMLAPSESLRPSDLLSFQGFPVWASPKLDGIRCCIVDGQAMSRNLKPIQNEYIRECLKGFPQLDGELMLRDPQATFQDVTSAVMSRSDTPDFCFWVFDCFAEPNEPFVRRNAQARAHVTQRATGENAYRIAMLHHDLFIGGEGLRLYEQKCLDDGFEGIMLRSPGGLYKYGRATRKEGTLIKVKRFFDDEAEAVGFEEEMHNGNAPKVNALGRTQRSAHKAGKVGKCTLGKLVCSWHGKEIRVAGFTDAMADKVWANQEEYVGKFCNFAYQELTNEGAPRFPMFKGWREKGV